MAQILRLIYILQCIMRGIYSANAARGRALKLRVLRGWFWIFFEYECAELKQLAPVGYDIALYIKDTAPRHRLLDYPDSWVAY